jgi:RNA polymerase-binding transcription factor DksA
MATSKSTKTDKAVKSIRTAKTAKPAPARTAQPAVRSAIKLAAKAATKPVAKPAHRLPPATEAKKAHVPAATTVKPAPKAGRFSDKDLDAFRKELMAMRDRLTGQVAKMRQDSLKREDEVNPEEDGTDAFDRLFALERAGSDQNVVFNIDEAIRAINEGRYGVCEGCGKLIEKPRLHALPFAKNCIGCQSELEHGRNERVSRRVVP